MATETASARLQRRMAWAYAGHNVLDLEAIIEAEDRATREAQEHARAARRMELEALATARDAALSIENQSAKVVRMGRLTRAQHRLICALLEADAAARAARQSAV